MRARIHTHTEKKKRDRKVKLLVTASGHPVMMLNVLFVSEAGRWQRAPTKETFREFGLLYLGNRLNDSAKKLTNEKF